VIPTLIANAFFLPHHLLPRDDADELAAGVAQTSGLHRSANAGGA
jgi:hypothetical protein